MITLIKDDWSPLFARLAALGQNPTPVMRAIGREFKRITEDNFTAAGSAMRPIPWVNTYRMKANPEGIPATLRLHNVLANSFHLEVSAGRATLKTPVPYAAIHQFGGPLGSKKHPTVKHRDIATGQVTAITGGVGTMPARPFFPILNDRLTPAARARMEAAAQRAAEREVKR